MNKIYFAVLAIIIAGGVGVFFLKQTKENVSTASPLSASTAPTSSPLSDLGSGGSSYLDQKGVYNFLYPNDYTLDTADPLHIRIYKRGETQRPQSEMSDGALMVFETVELKGVTLEKWVDTRISESTADGTSEITEAKKMVTQNGYPGFYYAIRGLGISQNLILQKDLNSDNAVVITYAISDPEQKGYQSELDAVLKSLRLLK
jgi:hypothetical protein